MRLDKYFAECKRLEDQIGDIANDMSTLYESERRDTIGYKLLQSKKEELDSELNKLKCEDMITTSSIEDDLVKLYENEELSPNGKTLLHSIIKRINPFYDIK